MLKLRILSVLVVVFLLASIVMPPPVSAAEGDNYRYIKKAIFYVLADLVGGDEGRAQEIVDDNFNDGEQNDLVYTDQTVLIGMNCDNADDPQSGGPNCEQYFYPRQEADGGVYNGNPRVFRVFTNLEALADTQAYEEGSIHVPLNDPRTGRVIPLVGPEFEIDINDPDNFAPEVEEICQGDNPSPDCDRFVDEPTDGGEAPEQPDCREELPGALSWAVCAVLEWVDSSISSLLDTLNGLLSVGREEIQTPEMRQAWSFFRNIASLLLVVIGLIMIIGQAISKE